MSRCLLTYIFCFVSFLSSTLYLKAESNENYLLHWEGVRMTIPFEVKAGAHEDTNESLFQECIENAFNELDITYNNWNPRSEISLLNQAKAGEKVLLSNGLAKFLYQCQEYVLLSEGRFDPTIKPLYDLWESKLKNNQIPTTQELEALKEYVGWHHLKLEGQSVTKSHDKVAISLGGIAKGLGVDLVLDSLQKAGFKNIFVNWGGEIRSLGQHPQNRQWKALVRFWKPMKEGFVVLNDSALATSGDYLQNWTHSLNDKKRTYTHIVNPNTFSLIEMKKDTVSSVSIETSTCWQADALATIGMTFPNPQACAFWFESLKKKHPPFNYWVLSRESNEKATGKV